MSGNEKKKSVCVCVWMCMNVKRRNEKGEHAQDDLKIKYRGKIHEPKKHAKRRDHD